MALDYPEILPLDDTMIGLLADLRQQLIALQASRNGALMLFLRQKNLTGTWRIADNDREIIRVADAVPVDR
jgi:hypothetical protein